MKIELNFIYLPHGEKPPKKIYEDENGKIFRSSKRDSQKINIALGHRAIKIPKGKDSILVLEPKCVANIDYSKQMLTKFHKVFSWCKPAMKEIPKHKFVLINHPSWEEPPKFESLIRPDWEKRSGIIIVSNNKTSKHESNIYNLRIKLADYLFEKGYNISWYGNAKMDKPYYKGSVKNKMEVMRKAKFCICPENCYDPIYSWGYFSEKMTDAWFGGAVPLYMGCYNIDELNLPKSYIDLRNSVSKTGQNLHIKYDRIEKDIKNYNSKKHKFMIKDTEAFMKTPNGIYHEISMGRAYSKIIKAFL